MRRSSVWARYETTTWAWWGNRADACQRVRNSAAIELSRAVMVAAGITVGYGRDSVRLLSCKLQE